MRPHSIQSTPAVTTVEGRIHLVRGHKVILDRDLAELYGVSTKALNQAVKRNAERFPGEFLFRLTKEEAAALGSQIVILDTAKPTPPDRSQSVTGSPDAADGEDLRSQIVTSNEQRGGRRYFPYAFTEHGALMAANILRRPILAGEWGQAAEAGAAPAGRPLVRV